MSGYGERSRFLRVGRTGIRLEGLDEALEQLLEGRWGAYLEPSGSPGLPGLTVRIVPWDGADALALGDGEVYRIEALGPASPPDVLSYNFRLEARGDVWTARVRESPQEPIGRVLDNVARYLTARLSVAIGGFPLHAAGILRDERAWLFAGASNAGKTTAVGLSSPCTTLGDDMAIVFRDATGWQTVGLPFDNSERGPAVARTGPFPVAGIWQLFQAPEHRLERRETGPAIASLMGCAAFPWALPDLSEELLANAARFVLEGRFEALHFRRDAGFWKLLEPPRT